MISNLNNNIDKTASLVGTKNILIIGFGTMGKIHAAKINQINIFGLIAVVDTNEHRLQEARSAGYTTYNNLDSAYQSHKNFDVVVITTNTATHYYYIEQVIVNCTKLNLSLPALFVEKPIVATKQQAEQVQRLLIENDYPSAQTFMCGYLLRESPAVAKLIEKIIDDGESISSIIIKWQKQRKADRASAGVIQDEATHSLDLVQYILHRLSINHDAHSLNVLSAIRSRDIVNVGEQDLIYPENDGNRNPFAEINYTLKFGDVTVNALSSFMRTPQERSIVFSCKNKSYRLVFDDKGQDWCDTEPFAADKIACLWQSFVSSLHAESRPVHIASISESVSDVMLTTVLEEKANIFLRPQVQLLFSLPKISVAKAASTTTYCGFKPGFLLG